MRFSLNSILTVMLLSLLASSGFSEIYQWTDENGQVHFSDRKPAETPVETVELEKSSSKWQPYDIQIINHGSDVTNDELKRIQNDVNAVYLFYKRIFYFDFYKTVPVSINIFPSQREYQAYVEKVTGQSGSNSLGVYITSLEQIAVFMDEDRDRVFRTIKHEASHAVINSETKYITAWFNEGLAELIEFLEIEDDRIVLYAHNYNQKAMEYYSAQVSLKDYFAIDSNEWRAGDMGRAPYLRAMAGELLYYLMSNPSRRIFVSQLLHEYKQGSRYKTSHLFENHYFGSVESMDKRWKEWIAKDKPSKIVF